VGVPPGPRGMGAPPLGGGRGGERDRVFTNGLTAGTRHHRIGNQSTDRHAPTPVDAEASGRKEANKEVGGRIDDPGSVGTGETRLGSKGGPVCAQEDPTEGAKGRMEGGPTLSPEWLQPRRTAANPNPKQETGDKKNQDTTERNPTDTWKGNPGDKKKQDAQDTQPRRYESTHERNGSGRGKIRNQGKQGRMGGRHIHAKKPNEYEDPRDVRKKKIRELKTNAPKKEKQGQPEDGWMEHARRCQRLGTK